MQVFSLLPPSLSTAPAGNAPVSCCDVRLVCEAADRVTLVKRVASSSFFSFSSLVFEEVRSMLILRCSGDSVPAPKRAPVSVAIDAEKHRVLAALRAASVHSVQDQQRLTAC